MPAKVAQNSAMGFKLMRIAGIDVHVDWSLLIVFLLIVNSLALGLFPSWHPDWSGGLAWATAVAAALLFFASVLAHELSHALVGRKRGAVVPRITLFVFGGVAHLEHEPNRWRAELWMAAVGPLTSLVIAVVCVFLAGVLVPEGAAIDLEHPEKALAQLGPGASLLLWLGQVNLMLGIFNLVPAFPLDGGRVLRALLWGATGDMRRATRWASRLGQAFAWLLIALGVLMILGARVPVFGGGAIGGVWLAFIGWFLNNAALMSYRQLLTRDALEGVPVSRLMQTRFESIPPDMTVHALVEEHLLRSGQRAFPVLDGERLRGMVCLSDVTSVSPERRASTRVAEIMTPAERLASVPPSADAYEALALLGQRGLAQIAVIEDGRLRGLLRREDVLGWLALHQGPDVDGLASAER